ncbi:MAG: transporter related-protein [Verrucomicrobiales bacterium]|nr:transporter related-protein [Verrucomicrobiales bacterium]
MGRNKSDLILAGTYLLDHARIICRAAGLENHVSRTDSVERCGPLGGIVTAFKTLDADRIVFLSCDMPFVSPAIIDALQKCAMASNRSMFLRHESKVGFPFLIRRADLPRVCAQIDRREYSLQSLAAVLNSDAVVLPTSSQWQLFNINTPAEMRGAVQIYREHQKELEKRVPVLAVQNLVIRRDKTFILKNLSWRINSGEHWVILGANGSGKTSLLSALTGYLMPTSGSIELLGEIYGESDWRELRKKVGLVSSSIRQMMAEPETALETIISGKNAMIDLWGTPSRADVRRAREILNQIECAHLSDRPWSVLSQGERQRILIGRSLMADPKVLILDEPCAGLDPVARETFLNFLEQLGRSPSAPALILVTHHVEEITPAFQNALILLQGELLVAGPVKNALTSATLSEAFDSKVKLTLRNSGYRLTVTGRRDRVL